MSNCVPVMKHQTKEMTERIRRQLHLLTVILMLCSTTVLAACGSSDDQTGQDGKGKVAEIVSRGTLLVGTTGDYQKNEEIPTLIAEGKADVMITEITEAPYYVQADPRLAAPLLSQPFTHGQIGVLMQKGQDYLMLAVNATIRKMKSDGTLRRLHEKYGLVYAY